MKYSDLIKKLAKDTGATQAQTTTIIKAFVATTKEELGANGTITIPEFGTLKLNDRAERTYKANKLCPRDITVPAHKVPVFSASSALKEIAAKVK